MSTSQLNLSLLVTRKLIWKQTSFFLWSSFVNLVSVPLPSWVALQLSKWTSWCERWGSPNCCTILLRFPFYLLAQSSSDEVNTKGQRMCGAKMGLQCQPRRGRKLSTSKSEHHLCTKDLQFRGHQHHTTLPPLAMCFRHLEVRKNRHLSLQATFLTAASQFYGSTHQCGACVLH